MAFMQRLACERLPEMETVLVAEFKHAANSLGPNRTFRAITGLRVANFLFHKRLKITFHIHAVSLSLGEKPGFEFRLKMESDSHRPSISVYRRSPASLNQATIPRPGNEF